MANQLFIVRECTKVGEARVQRAGISCSGNGPALMSRQCLRFLCSFVAVRALSWLFVLFLPSCAFTDDSFGSRGSAQLSTVQRGHVVANPKKKIEKPSSDKFHPKWILSLLAVPIRKSTEKQEKAEKARKGIEKHNKVEKARTDASTWEAHPYILMISLRARRGHSGIGHVELQSQGSIRVLRIANPASCNCCRINASY